MRTHRSRRKKFKVFFPILFLLIAILALFHKPILHLPANWLVRHDNPEKNADYILIMMGDVGDRTAHAAQLYHDGYGKRIIIAEAEFHKVHNLGLNIPDGEATYRYLQMLNVPIEDIIFLSTTRNTSSQEEVKTVIDYLKEADPNAQRLILVTSWYHSSRAFWILERTLNTSIKIESFPTPQPEDFWKEEKNFLYVYVEYLKWVYYLVTY